MSIDIREKVAESLKKEIGYFSDNPDVALKVAMRVIGIYEAAKTSEQPERCKHGVWASDRCEDCYREQPDDSVFTMDDVTRVATAIRDASMRLHGATILSSTCAVYADAALRVMKREVEQPVDSALKVAAEILNNFKGEGNKIEEWQACYAKLFTQMNELVNSPKREYRGVHGYEISGNTIYIGPMRPDRVKVADITCTIDWDETYTDKAKQRRIRDAERICRGLDCE